MIGLHPAYLQPLTVIRWHFGAGIFYQTVIKTIEKRKPFLRAPELWFEVQTMVEPSGYPERGSLYRASTMDGWLDQSTMHTICSLANDVRLAKWSWI